VSAEDWERRSWTAWWSEDGAAAIEARERAYRGFKDAGDRRGAARMALWLALDHHEFRGEEAVAQGWFARCERILADLEPAPEHGWLAAFQAAFVLDEGDSVTARALGANARELGRALELTALEMTGLATEGLAMVEQGEVRPGMRCLDEASAAALGGEYEEDFPVCWTCCYLIYACERVRDFERAAQWCRKVAEYSERRRIRWVRHVCRAHYAAVLTWRGEWDAAERELLDARQALLATRPAWAPEATVRLADLRRRQGRLEEAERLFAASGPHLLAVLGRGELALDRGHPDAAIAFAEQLLRRLPDSNVTQRAGALELLVRARASRDDLDALRVIVETVGGDPLLAALRRCEGVVARAEGDVAAARAAFEDAAALYAACGAPFESARARRELASPAGALSAREAEVLRLVARGLTDRQIAAELVLSRHTVHRHVSNVYAKLGCSSRAAAVARATELGVLG
jgi:LuxR family transcriptional regulator, maltose regulon positive regulatory protein